MFLAVLPLFVHIKTARAALSAERVYDIHCITFGSRPSALVSWWLGNTQLLDHSTSVRNVSSGLVPPSFIAGLGYRNGPK